MRNTRAGFLFLQLEVDFTTRVRYSSRLGFRADSSRVTSRPLREMPYSPRVTSRRAADSSRLESAQTFDDCLSIAKLKVLPPLRGGPQVHEFQVHHRNRRWRTVDMAIRHANSPTLTERLSESSRREAGKGRAPSSSREQGRAMEVLVALLVFNAVLLLAGSSSKTKAGKRLFARDHSIRGTASDGGAGASEPLTQTESQADTEEGVNLPKRVARKIQTPTPSPVWEFMTRLPEAEGGGVRCDICAKSRVKTDQLTDSGGTTNLLRHIERKHPSVYETFSKKKGTLEQASMRAFVAGTPSNFNLERFWELIIIWIVDNDQAFRVVENRALRAAFKYCCKFAVLPGATTTRRKIGELYQTLLPKVQNLLTSAPGRLAFTTDEWTSPNSIAFKGITCHFIDTDWKLRSLLLGFAPVTGQHTAQKLLEVFMGVLGSWGLSLSRVMAITFDNASTNEAFLKELSKLGFPLDRGLRCLAHVINLAANRLLDDPTAKSVADKVRKVSRHVGAQGSAQRMEAWLKQCPRRLGLDCKTRWSSTYNMLKIAQTLRAELTTWWSNLASPLHRTELEITEREWQAVELLIELLAPMSEATDLACTHSQPSSMCLPLYLAMYLNLKGKATQPEYSPFEEAIQQAIALIDKYYALTPHCLTASSILDPRVKFSFFQTHFRASGYDSADEAMSHVREELSEYLDAPPSASQHSTTSPVSSQHTTTGVAGNLLENLLRGGGEPEDSAADELEMFGKLPVQSFKTDPLLWWATHCTEYPKLAVAPRDFLPARCTSADVERAFSEGRQLISTYRHKLGAETITQCMLVKSWTKALGMVPGPEDILDDILEGESVVIDEVDEEAIHEILEEK